MKAKATKVAFGISLFLALLLGIWLAFLYGFAVDYTLLIAGTLLGSVTLVYFIINGGKLETLHEEIRDKLALPLIGNVRRIVIATTLLAIVVVILTGLIFGGSLIEFIPLSNDRSFEVVIYSNDGDDIEEIGRASVDKPLRIRRLWGDHAFIAQARGIERQDVIQEIRWSLPWKPAVRVEIPIQPVMACGVKDIGVGTYSGRPLSDDLQGGESFDAFPVRLHTAPSQMLYFSVSSTSPEVAPLLLKRVAIVADSNEVQEDWLIPYYGEPGAATAPVVRGFVEVAPKSSIVQIPLDNQPRIGSGADSIDFLIRVFTAFGRKCKARIRLTVHDINNHDRPDETIYSDNFYLGIPNNWKSLDSLR